MRPSKIVELPTRLLAQAIGGERRHKRLGIIGGIVLVALGIGAYVTVTTVESKSSEAMAAELGALHTCLLGDPLAADEKPSARIRRVRLAALSIPQEQRAKTGELPWPSNCAVYALALSDRNGGATSAGIGTTSATLGKALKDEPSGTKLLELVDAAFKEFVAKDLKPMAVTNVPIAPKAMVPIFDTAKFTALPRALSGKFQLSAVKPETAPHAMLRFVIDTKGGPDGALLCTATGGASGSVKCFKVPAPVLEGAQTLSLGGTSDNGAQPVFVANAGDDASIYMPDGKKVASGLLLGAHTRETGTASLLVRSDKTAKLIVISATAAPQDLGSIDPRVTHATHAGLGYDQVVWFGGKPGETHLYARKLKSTGFDVTPAVDLGESSAAPNVDNKESVIDFCKTGEATIARGRAGQVDVLAVLAGGRWSIPMKGGPAGGALTCRALDGVTTHIEHKLEDEKNWATVTYTKCNPGGCTATKLPLREILGATPELVPADTKAIAVADVGGKLALVWSAGAAGGIRLRFAAPDRMKETSDVVIYDGHEEGAIAGLSSFVDMKLLPLEEDALLLLSTTSGVRALRIDKAGAVTSMPMSL